MGEGEQFTGTAILSATVQLLTGSTLLENNRRRETILWPPLSLPLISLFLPLSPYLPPPCSCTWPALTLSQVQFVHAHAPIYAPHFLVSALSKFLSLPLMSLSLPPLHVYAPGPMSSSLYLPSPCYCLCHSCPPLPVYAPMSPSLYLHQVPFSVNSLRLCPPVPSLSLPPSLCLC